MSETVMETPAGAPAAARKGFLARLIGVFVSPGETFEDIRRKPTFLAPMLVLMVLFGAVNYVLMPISMAEQAELVSSSPRFQTLPEATQEQQLSFMRNPPGWFSAVMAVALPIGLVVVILLYTLLLWGAGRVLGGDPTFPRVFSMLLFASMIHPILASLVKMPLILSKGTVFGVTLSPALFLPDLEITSRTYVLMNTGLDFFSVWGAIVGGIGLAKVSKISTATGISIVLVVYAIRSAILYLQVSSNLPS